MQVVELNIVAYTAEIIDGKPVVVQKERREKYVTASTKSTNNLLDEVRGVKKENVSNYKATEFFLDEKATREAVEALVDSQVDDTYIAEATKDHIIKALYGACVLYKPSKRSK